MAEQARARAAQTLDPGGGKISENIFNKYKQ